MPLLYNSESQGGAICTLDTNGTQQTGGAIFAVINSTLTVNGTIYFTNNGHYGGGVHRQNGDVYGSGVCIRLKCTFSILPNTTVYWENNHASLGGAIYVHDASPISYSWTLAMLVPKEECFFRFPGQNLSNGVDVQFVF